MSLQSKPYFWVRCDNCGADCEYGDFSAMSDAGQAEDGARDGDWSCEQGKHHCPSCPLLCENCGESAGDDAGERDYRCPACFAAAEARESAAADAAEALAAAQEAAP